MFAFGLCLFTAHFAAAQEGFQLAPGEKLLAVNGVPVNQSSPAQQSYGVQQANWGQRAGDVQQTSFVQPATVSGYAPVPMQMPTRGGSSAVVGEGTAAYQHALREAQIIAARGGNYHRTGDGGHPLGVAPGCSYSGTGYTWDPNRPGHCYLGELPDSRLVARARAQGANGAWFWSAHYR